MFFCNPSVGHCLAVGMNKDYYLVKNPEQNGVQTHLPIENIINSQDFKWPYNYLKSTD